MNVITLPITPDEFLKRLKFATETDTVEKNQTSAKEAVFYSHTVDNCFELYERPAFTRERTFYFGGILMRGAVAECEGGCQVATEFGRFTSNTHAAIGCGVLFVLSVIGTILSGNLFATMLPIPALLCGGFLIADGFGAAIQVRRLKKKWEVILSRTLMNEGR